MCDSIREAPPRIPQRPLRMYQDNLDQIGIDTDRLDSSTCEGFIYFV